MTIQNLSFFAGRQDKTTDGMLVTPYQNPETKQTTYAVLLDSLSNLRRGKVPMSIPLDMKSRPEIRGEKAMSGSVITQQVNGKNFSVLAANKENGIWYVLVRTGLFVKNGGILEDLIALQDSNVNLKAHGSFSLDGGAAKVGSGKGIELAKVPAERLRWSVKRPVAGLDLPAYRYDMWKVPVGAAVLVRDISGKLTRLVGEKDSLRVVDAPAAAYDQVFDGLENARIAANKAKAEAGKAANAATAGKA